MMLESFILEEHGAVALLKVNRPKALNALNSKVLTEFSRVLEALDARNELRAVILTGAGEKSFIAGADIAEMASLSKDEALEFARRGQRVTQQLEGLRVPVIAAVNGYALGGGCEMALACDFIIASGNAVFGQPEVCLGLMTGFGGGVRLAEFVGWPRARELIYTGRRIGAEEAFRIGLVNRVVASDKLIAEALAVAAELSANSPLAVRSVKAAMVKVRSEATLSGKLEIEARAFAEVFTSRDQREGTSAFLEKRKPQFTGE